MEFHESDPHYQLKQSYNHAIERVKNHQPDDNPLVYLLLNEFRGLLEHAPGYYDEFTDMRGNRLARYIHGILNLFDYVSDDIVTDPLLRDYQKQRFIQIVEYFRSPPSLENHTRESVFYDLGGIISGTLELPPGYGKTYIIKRFLEITGWRMAYFVNSLAVLDQTRKLFSDADHQYRTYNALHNTLIGRAKQPVEVTDYDILVFDEGHNLSGENYQNIFLIPEVALKPAIFMTATPTYRRDKSLYNLQHRRVDLITRRSIPEAIEIDGALATTSAHLVTLLGEVGVGIPMPEMDPDGDDYDSGYVSELVSSSGAMSAVVDIIRNESALRPTKVIVNCELIADAMEQAQRISERLPEFKVIPVFGKMEQEKEFFEHYHPQIVEFAQQQGMNLFTAAITMFRSGILEQAVLVGDIRGVTQIKTLREGFSDTDVNLVINLAPTKSWVAAEQRLRCLRISDDELDKHAKIYDIVYPVLAGTQILAHDVLGKSIIENRFTKLNINRPKQDRVEYRRRQRKEKGPIPGGEYRILTSTEETALLHRLQFFKSRTKPLTSIEKRQLGTTYVDVWGNDIEPGYTGIKIIFDDINSKPVLSYFHHDRIIIFLEDIALNNPEEVATILSGGDIEGAVIESGVVRDLLGVQLLILQAGYLFDGGFDPLENGVRPIEMTELEATRMSPVDLASVDATYFAETARYLLSRLVSSADGIALAIDLEPTLFYTSAEISINDRLGSRFGVERIKFGKRTVGFYINGHLTAEEAQARAMTRLARQGQLLEYQAQLEGRSYARRFLPIQVYDVGMTSADINSTAWQVVFDNEDLKPFKIYSPFEFELLQKIIYEGSITYFESEELADRHRGEFTLSAVVAFHDVLAQLNSKLRQNGVRVISDKKTGYFVENFEDSDLAIDDAAVERSRASLAMKMRLWIVEYAELNGLPKGTIFDDTFVTVLRTTNEDSAERDMAILLVIDSLSNISADNFNFYVLRADAEDFWQQFVEQGGYLDDAMFDRKLAHYADIYPEVVGGPKSVGYCFKGREKYRIAHLEKHFRGLEKIDPEAVSFLPEDYEIIGDDEAHIPPQIRVAPLGRIDEHGLRAMSFRKDTVAILEYTIFTPDSGAHSTYLEIPQTQLDLFVESFAHYNLNEGKAPRGMYKPGFYYIVGDDDGSKEAKKSADAFRKKLSRLNDSILVALQDVGLTNVSGRATRRMWEAPNFT